MYGGDPALSAMHRLALLGLLLWSPLASAQPAPDWTPMPWLAACEGGYDPGDHVCADEEGTTARWVGDQLDRATAWLHGLGFPEPAVDRWGDDDRYVAVIGPDTMRVDGSIAHGYYRKGAGGYLVVNTTHFFQLDGEDDNRGTPAHELFHAVQAAYPASSTARGEADWIVEGTAQAVEAAYLGRFEGVRVMGEGGHAYVYGVRNYGAPVHEPPEAGQQEYATSHFWLALGETLGSTDRVAYLHDALRVSDQHPGALLDEVTADAGGFAEVFPRLLGRYATNIGHFRGYRTRVRTGPGFEGDLAPTVEPLAGHMTAIVAVTGETLSVEVEYDATDPALHYVFDGVHADDIGLAPDVDGRVSYRTLLAPGDTLKVHTVNVSPEAAASAPAQARYTVRAEAPCDGDDDGLWASAQIGGPSGMLGLGSRAVLSPAGGTSIHLPFEPVVLSRRGGTFNYYPAVAGDEETLHFGAPDQEDLDAMRGSARGPMPSRGVGSGVTGSLSIPDGQSYGPAFEFLIAKPAPGGGLSSIRVRVRDSAAPGTYRAGLGGDAVTISVSVGGGRMMIPQFNDALSVTLVDVEPGQCAAGTFAGSLTLDQDEPSVFSVSGSFLVRAPEDAVTD